ncbi:hypothetical protein ABID76_000069 [Burkholderia ambifaria]
MPPAARAEIDDHLAAARRDQRAQQLATLILHLDLPFLEQLQARERRLADDAHALRRERRLARVDAVRAQRVDHLVARRLLRVGTQVERRRVVQRGGELREFVGVETGRQRLVDPVRQVRAHAHRQARRIDLRHVLEPRGLGVGHERLQRIAAERLHQAQQREAPCGAARAALGKVRKLHLPAQHREHRLGDHAALGVAELRVRAEEPARRRVGGAGELQHLRQQGLGLANQESVQLHTPSLVSVCG